VKGLLDALVDVRLLQLGLIETGEGPQAAYDLGDPLSSLIDDLLAIGHGRQDLLHLGLELTDLRFRFVADSIEFVQSGPKVFRGAYHGANGIIELVSYSGHQPSHGGHLFGLNQLALSGFKLVERFLQFNVRLTNDLLSLLSRGDIPHDADGTPEAL